MKKLFYFILVSFVCINYACNKDKNMHVKYDERTFHEQKQLWQASNTKDYEYHLFADGYMLYDGKIIVENGRFKEEEILHTLSIPSIDMLIGYSTIDRIYETIEEAIKYNTYKEIWVEYDKINHIPIRINFIREETPGLAVDGTFDYSISDFKKTTN